ncbi:MAG: aminopeptidase P family protein [Candidatus Lokiarchaeota archaeon]|nr:aminopeptidase P family protein [Candidatus Lokiarchaeota archaeon]
MRPITEEKFESVLEFLEEKKIDVLMITDYENSRNINLQYLSGHPTDATIFITSSGESILIPWDVALAEKYSEVDEIINPANFSYNIFLVFKDLFENRWNKSSHTIGVHSMTSYGFIVKMKAIVANIKYFEAPIEVEKFFQKLRATKSEFEIKKLMKAAEIGTKAITDIQDFCLNTPDGTEKDLSFLVRKKIAQYGADDVSFEPLVANSSRAHEIHQYPYASDQKFNLPGLALIDFGANFQGYCSDITVPISFGKLTDEHIKMREIVVKAYEAAIEMIDIDVPMWKVHDRAEQILKEGGFSMPYSLGHGLGLSVHDSPLISRKPTDEYSKKYWKEETFQEGMVFTIEPGVMKQGLGGQRVENDVVIRNGKVEIITGSKPLSF